MIYAVIDTNVFISALITKNSEADTVQVLNAVMQVLINSVIKYGVEVFPKPTGEILIDMDDLIVTPSEMMEIINTSHAI